jgi:CHAT domain-containing protein/Tfp pilus assembly protein PilF
MTLSEKQDCLRKSPQRRGVALIRQVRRVTLIASLASLIVTPANSETIESDRSRGSWSVETSEIMSAPRIDLLISTFSGQPQRLVDMGQTVQTPFSKTDSTERSLKGGEVHSYELRLARAQYVHVVVHQRGIDVVLTLFGQDGAKLYEADRPNGSFGPEELFWIATSEGNYHIEVRSLEKTAAAGKYELRIDQPRESTPQDQKRMMAQAALSQGTSLNSQGKPEQAQEVIKSFTESLRLWLETDERSSAGYTAGLLARVYRDLGNNQKAIETYQQAQSLHRSVKDSSGEAAALNSIAGVYSRIGDSQQALANFNQALLLHRQSGDRSDEAVVSNNIGLLYENAGEYRDALKYYDAAIAIFRELGEAQNEAAVLNNAGEAYTYLGEYEKALDALQKAIVTHRASGDRYREATALHGIGSVYAEMRQGRKGLEYLTQALELRKSIGDRSGEASTLFEIGVIYWDLREYQKSLDYTFRAVENFRQAGDRVGEAAALYHIGWVYFSMSDNKKATEFLPQALQVYRAIGHQPGQITTLDTLSRAWANSGDFRQALECTKEKLSLIKARGNQRAVAAATGIIGILYAELGETQNAIDYLLRALELDRSAGDRSEEAICLNGLGWLYYTLGEEKKAAEYYEQAHSIWKVLNDSDQQAKVLYNLAELRCNSGDWESADKLLEESLDLEESKLGVELLSGGEWEKQFFLQSFIRSLQLSIGINAQYAPRDSTATRLALTTILRRKGRVLDAMSNEFSILRASAAPETVALLDQLNRQVSRQTQLKIRGPQNLPLHDYQSLINESQEKVEELQLKLSASSARIRSQSQKVSVEAVQQFIPTDGVLVEFAVWTPFQPDRDWRNKFGKPRYVAYVLLNQGEPKVLNLGDVQTINALSRKFLSQLRDSATETKEVKGSARALDELIMRPIRKSLGTQDRLLISPEGQLNLVPFAALVDERGEYLVTKYKISYLTSGRDLLRLQIAREPRDAPLIIANPDFEETAAGEPRTVIKNNGSRSTLVNEMKWAALPATETEAKAIKNLIPASVVKTKTDATETAVKKVNAPSILHFATHGFFLADVAQDEQPLVNTPVSSGVADAKNTEHENRMLRSGLVLAGANQKRSGDDDGILTAMEMAGLNLWGTKLVVMSACETGVGEVQVGEGVYGLRRAIVLAGAEAQVMSLWKVDDKATAQLMADYYLNLLKKGAGRADALRQVQLSMLANKETRHPYFWAGFIESGAWANISPGDLGPK